MHVIYVGSKTSIVPQSTRQSFRENLAWIGKVMGIGQAEVISDVSWNDYVMMLVLTSPLSLQQLFRGNLSWMGIFLLVLEWLFHEFQSWREFWKIKSRVNEKKSENGGLSPNVGFVSCPPWGETNMLWRLFGL